MVRTTEYFIPYGNNANTENERARINADLEYYRGFLASVMKNSIMRVSFRMPLLVFLNWKKRKDLTLNLRSNHSRNHLRTWGVREFRKKSLKD